MNLLELVVLALAAYRVTRLIVIDTILDEVREWFFLRLDFKYDKTTSTYTSRNLVAKKLSYLLQCTWCTGVWVSLALYWFWFQKFDFVEVAAIAGAQGMIHALEPSDE